jgi:hypothetical protein
VLRLMLRLMGCLFEDKATSAENPKTRKPLVKG